MSITVDPDKVEDIELNIYETRLRGQYIFPTGKGNEAIKKLVNYAAHFNFEIIHSRFDNNEEVNIQVLDFVLIKKGKD